MGGERVQFLKVYAWLVPPVLTGVGVVLVLVRLAVR